MSNLVENPLVEDIKREVQNIRLHGDGPDLTSIRRRGAGLRRRRRAAGAVVGAVGATGLVAAAFVALPHGQDPRTSAAAVPVPRQTASTWRGWDAMHLQWRTKYVECARSVGLDASVTTDGIAGGSSMDRPRDSQTGLDAECIQRTGLPPLGPQMTDELLDGLYQLSLEQAACLKAEGYKVDPAPPREQWKSDYRYGTPWGPMERLVKAEQDVYKAMAKCPEPDPRDIAP
jgi:hypothetical protein